MESQAAEETGSHKRTTAGGLIVVIVVAAFLLYPPVTAFQNLGSEAVFNFFAQDTFYYISVANKSATGFYTFDGELPVNGFHPLWQFLLTALFNAFGGSDQSTQLLIVFVVAALFTMAGYCLAGLAVYNVSGSKVLGIMIIPGLVHLLCLFTVQRAFSSPWNAMNGMESCATVLFGGMLLCLYSVALGQRREFLSANRFYWLVGIILSLIVMARLDDVFLVAAFGFCYLTLRKRTFWDNARKALILALPTALLLICYLIFNYWRVGTPFPISGVTKGGFALADNLAQLVQLLTTRSFPEAAGVHYWTRLLVHALMWIPLLVALLFIGLVRGRKTLAQDNEKEVLLMALLVYVCLKALYNLVYVHANFQGNWYFVLSGLSVTFVALVLLAKPYRDMVEGFGRYGSCVGLFLVLLVALHVVFSAHVFTRRGNMVHKFWNDAGRVASQLRAVHPGVKLVEFDDGFIGYSLTIPAIHGMGFLLDYDGYVSRRGGRFLEYCYRRGFDTIASMQYIRPPRKELSAEELRAILKIYELRLENLNDYTFELILYHQETGTSFIRFRPRSAAEERKR